MSTRPLFPYYGSKWNMARYYAPPAHDRVVEPFAGGAGYALFWGVRDAVLVEADPVIAGLWRYLIAADESEILALPLLPEVGDSVVNYDLSPGARALIGLWLNRGSATPKLSRTAYSARTDKAQLNWGERARQRVADSLHAVRGWTVIEGDFSQAPDIEATWFIDPPYGDKGRYYRVPFSRFEDLGAFCRSRRGQVIACENDGATWLPFEPLGSFKATRGRSAEVVWTNAQEAA